uniref:Uncharacterized protein n=1 Tax=Arundo donax TaxID=35708 RepID=A0A0A9BHR9_ARUDO
MCVHTQAHARGRPSPVLLFLRPIFGC